MKLYGAHRSRIAAFLLTVMMLGYVWGRHSVPVQDCVCSDVFDTDGDTAVEFVMRNHNRYCFSTWAPHGGLWNIACYDTLAECSKQLSDEKSIGASFLTAVR